MWKHHIKLAAGHFEADKVSEHGDYSLQLALRMGMEDQRMTKSSKTASSQAPDVLDIIDLTDL
jgi:hypothetical protein